MLPGQRGSSQLTQRGHVFTASNWEEADKGDLHARQSANGIPSRVTNVQPWAVPSHTYENKGMQREQVCDEDVAAPRRDHVSIEERGQRAPEGRAIFHRLDPQEEGED